MVTCIDGAQMLLPGFGRGVAEGGRHRPIAGLSAPASRKLHHCRMVVDQPCCRSQSVPLWVLACVRNGGVNSPTGKRGEAKRYDCSDYSYSSLQAQFA